MKVQSIRIERFRSFADETIRLDGYTCLVGVNGSGKSTVLAALNVLFQDQSGGFDVTKLTEEDYFERDTSSPVRITVTFGSLSPDAETELSAYVRNGQLVVTAEAVFDGALGCGPVRHYGQRLGMPQFRAWFEAEKRGELVARLKEIFAQLAVEFTGIGLATTKEAMRQALQAYESAHQDECSLIPSEDSFYGINSTGKLASFAQWIFVPAVKDAQDECLEAKNTALAKLIARVVGRGALNEEVERLRAEASARYGELLARNEAGLRELGDRLQHRLEEWAHADARLGLSWQNDPKKSVVMQTPVAGIKAGEGEFVGSLSRMGHGLQRSYLLALLQELADPGGPAAKTMILGVEEPELYQHPPQARHLADVLESLGADTDQVIVTTHSPFFVRGVSFEDVGLVRARAHPAGSCVRRLDLNVVAARIREVREDDVDHGPSGIIAKIHQSLQPGVAEMLFARVPVLVEGLEDEAYLTTQLHLLGRWQEFRRLGCHIVPVHGKGELVRPLAIAAELQIPAFVVFDADGDQLVESRRVKHEKDNKAILRLVGATVEPFPADIAWGDNYVVWPSTLAKAVEAELGAPWQRHMDIVRRRDFGDEPDLEKNALFISSVLKEAFAEGDRSAVLGHLCDSILRYASAARLG